MVIHMILNNDSNMTINSVITNNNIYDTYNIIEYNYYARVI